MTDDLTIPLCTFERVFDTVPHQEVVTLPELARALLRFEVKPKVLRRIDRELERIESVWRTWSEGRDAELGGRRWARLKRAEKEAIRDGTSVDASVEREIEHMRRDARGYAKKELRIWSPTLYRADAEKRGADNVTHVSCLVLDYDDGTPIEEASARWERWFHIIHTTWSHEPDFHKFRLILPLSSAVPAELWSQVWGWAEAKTGRSIDPACKSPASNYALPIIPHDQWPHTAFTRPGPILNPVEEEVVERYPRISREPMRGTEFSLVDGDPEARYVSVDSPAPSEPLMVADLDSDDVWSGGALDVGGALASASEPPPQRVDTEEPSVRELLRTVIGLLEQIAANLQTSRTLVDDLERMAALHDKGVLDTDELETVKRILIAVGTGSDASE